MWNIGKSEEPSKRQSMLVLWQIFLEWQCATRVFANNKANAFAIFLLVNFPSVNYVQYLVVTLVIIIVAYELWKTNMCLCKESIWQFYGIAWSQPVSLTKKYYNALTSMLHCQLKLNFRNIVIINLISLVDVLNVPMTGVTCWRFIIHACKFWGLHPMAVLFLPNTSLVNVA